MLSDHALRSTRPEASTGKSVTTGRQLLRGGWTAGAIRGQLDARRWQRDGRAVLLHNAPPSRREQLDIALINAGPRSVLTSFTAAEVLGLQGWLRPTIHVLVPSGARLSTALRATVHYASDWDEAEHLTARSVHRLPGALILAAGGFAQPRPAIGLIAAGVQQRRVRADELRSALARAPHIRHHAILLASIEDIAQGSHALSEIDFISLCRRAHLPLPRRQTIRMHGGRRRYLDAEWELPHGRRLVVEVDGALHLVPARWYADQLRQNDLVLDGTMVLRFPSVVVRTEEQLVLRQLRRALGLPS
jgi:hypothetical protein